MTEQDPLRSDRLTTSTGHDLSEANWLDRHFTVAQPEYEATLRSVGIEKGWHVLDAGCGNGEFIPLLSELVGAGGHISALDFTPENIEQLDARLANGNLGCTVETTVGDVMDLPYDDDQFDTVWCSNVSQYLTGEELHTALSEFVRVTRPAGIVAVKEFDCTVAQWYQEDPTFVLRICGAIGHAHPVFRGTLRTIRLRDWFVKAGLVDIQYTTTLVERFAPLTPVERQFAREVIQFVTGVAIECGVPEPDSTICHKLSDIVHVNAMIDQPNFYIREGYALIVGLVP